MGVLERYQKRKTENNTSGGVMARYEKRKEYESLGVDQVNDAYISSFVSDANRFFGQFQNGSEPTYTDAGKTISDLDTRYQTISGWLYKNKSNLDEKAYSDFSASLSDFGKSLARAKDYYGQFDSEEAYQTAKIGWLNPESGVSAETASARKERYTSNQARIEELKKELPWIADTFLPSYIENIFLSQDNEALKKELETLETENRQYERTQGVLDSYYTPITDSFKANATYRDYKNASRETLWAYDMSTLEGSNALNNGGYFDADGNIRDVKGNIVQTANMPTVEDKLGLFLSASDDDLTEAYNALIATNGNYTNTWANLIQEGDVNGWRYLTEQEIDIYYDLYKRKGQKAAYQFLTDMKTELTRRETRAISGAIEEAPWYEKLGLNIASIPMNLAGGVTSFVDDATNLIQGKDTNPYSRGHSLQNIASAVRESTARGINRFTDNASLPFVGTTFGDVYQALMSAADSAVGVALGGNAYGALMGMGAASSVAKEMYEKGASNEQLVIGGILAGAAELLFEKYSLESLIKIKDSKTFRDILFNTLKQGGIEASEEMATELATIIQNAVIMGSQSDYQAYMDKYMAKGDSEFLAFIKSVFLDIAPGVLNAGMGGFISGGTMGGIASSLDYNIHNTQTKRLYADSAEELIAEGLASPVGTESHSLAEKYQKKLVTGKTLAGSELARLARANEAQIRLEEATADGEKEIADNISEKPLDTEEYADILDDAEKVSEHAGELSEKAVQPSQQALPQVEPAKRIDFENDLIKASEKYGEQAGAMTAIYKDGQDIESYDNAFGMAYEMGKSGVSEEYAMKSPSVQYLDEAQRALAYAAGKDAADRTAALQAKQNLSSANGKTGWKKGIVKGHGISLEELKRTFNDTQNEAYKLLSFYAEATGLDIALYRSDTEDGAKIRSAQGYFDKNDNTVYIDINAGLRSMQGREVGDLSQYTMMRTFSHEFIHFIEKWSPVRYNELRRAVFSEIEKRGEDIGELIEEKQIKNQGMSYDEASREVAAEALTEILPESDFLSLLAVKHESVFEMLREKFTEFVSRLKAHFKGLTKSHAREAGIIAKTANGSLRYAEHISELFDEAAAEAAENYQKTVATDADARESVGETGEGDFDENQKPLYRTDITLKDSLNSVSDEELRIGFDKAEKEYKLTPEELFGIQSYVNGSAYDLTRTQREGTEQAQSEYEAFLIDTIVSGLKKHPKFEGRTYRNLDFGTVFNEENAYADFINAHHRGAEITLKAFTSASKVPNGYPVSGKKVVHLVIEGNSAYDISETLNMVQKEVVYLPGTKYLVNEIATANDGNPIIYAKEIVKDEVQELRGSFESPRPDQRNEGVSGGQRDDSQRIYHNGGMQGSGGEVSGTQAGRTDQLSDGRKEAVTVSYEQQTEKFSLERTSAEIERAETPTSQDDGNRRGISEESGESESIRSGEADVLRERYRKLKQLDRAFSEDAYMTPRAGSVEEAEAISGADDVQEQSRAYLSDEAIIFRNDIDIWDKADRPSGETFILGYTGDVLQGLGAIENDIYMSGDKIKLILSKHPEITLEEIKKIPQILENPILILKSKNIGRETKANSRLVIFGTVKAANGNPVLSVLDLKPKENHLVINDMQKVSSTYTKDKDPIGFVNTSEVLYADEKRTAPLLRAMGFQMPIALQQSGFIGSISYTRDIVNIHGVPFSDMIQDNTVQYQERTDRLTDREVLAFAAENLHIGNFSKAEKDALAIFKKHLEKLGDLMKQRAELKKTIYSKEIDRKGAAETKEKIQTLEREIENASTDELLQLKAEREKLGKLYKEQQFGRRDEEGNTLERADRAAAAETRKHMAFLDQEIQKKKVGKIAELEAEKSKLHKLYEEQYTGIDFESENLKENLNRMKILDDQIKRENIALLSIEEKKVLGKILKSSREFVEAEERKKTKEAIRRFRETRDAALQKLKESRENALDKKRRTEMRHKIKDVVSELNRLLLNGTKENAVKLGLQSAVASALEAVNMDTVEAEARIAKYDRLIAEATDPDVIESLKATRENIQKQGDRMDARLEKLRQAYAEIRSGENGNAYPQNFREDAALIEERTEDVIRSVGDTPLRSMTLSQLSEVYELYKMVLTTVRDANKLFRGTRTESLTKAALGVMKELEAIPTLAEERAFFRETMRSFLLNELNPYYLFERIGSKTLSVYFWEAIKGQDVYARDMDEARIFAEETRERHGYAKWDHDSIREFKTADSRIFRLTLSHMLSIYAYSKRAQAGEHMRTGGFFFNDKETFRRKGNILTMIKSSEEGYKIDDALLLKIISSLTDDQKAYADEMQDYLTKMGKKGNEVSRVLWGIDQFKEMFYFPLKSSRDFIFEANQSAAETSLKNDGITKKTRPGASNPIILESFDDVWAAHVNKMSRYHAYVIPIENLNRILNWGIWADGPSVSVSTMLTGRYGNIMNEVLKRFIQDLNGAKGSDGAMISFLGNAFQKFKKNAVAASVSVMIQQPTAILRAQGEIDAKYFVHLPTHQKLADRWDEVKKYAPIAIIKEMGGIDTGAGRQVAEWLNADIKRGLQKISGKIDDAAMYGAERADKKGWCAIWEAVKREIKDTYPTINPDSKEFMELVGGRFTQIIVKTQVYDSPLSRSGYMRSSNELTKMATAFMGEPTLSLNIILDSVLQAKRGRMTKPNAVRRIASTYLAILCATFAKSLIYALRDDDEDESLWEKYWQAFGGAVFGDINPLAMLPGVRDVISIFDGWDIERTDMALFSDLKNAVDGLDSESKSAWRKAEDFAGAVAAFFGLPLKNVMRTLREVYNVYENMTDEDVWGSAGSAFLEGAFGIKEEKASPYTDLLKSVRNLSSIRTEMRELTSHGYTEKEIVSKIKSEVGKWYRGGEITRAEAEKMLMKYADIDRETMKKTVDKWSCVVVTGIAYEDIDDKYLVGEITRARAIRMYMLYGNMTKEEATKKVDKLKE